MADSRLPIQIAAPDMSSVYKREAPVDSSAVYIRGAILVQDGSDGELTEGGANPTKIVGVAIHKNPPTNNTSETGYYIPALPACEFEASIDDGSSEGTGAIAAGDLFAEYGLTEDSSGVWYVDKNKTGATTVRVVVTKLIGDVGEVLGRVRFRFLGIIDLTGTPVAVTLYAGN